jgi:hypothetical protein
MWLFESRHEAAHITGHAPCSSDEEAAALTRADITGNDRYPFSERIGTLKAILAKLRVETSPKAQGAQRRR